MIDLSNQVALITGGSRGVGAATAVMMARAGARIVVAYQKDKNAAKKIMQAVQELGIPAHICRGKIEKESDCRAMCNETLETFGRIDILVNSAGIWEYGEIGSMTSAAWEKTIAINLTGIFNMCNVVVPIMKKQQYGRIINISSTAGQRGEAFHSHYGASKGGVIAFTKSIAPELIPFGIWVNCVAPGWVETDMTASEMRNAASRRKILQAIPRHKIATPEEIAGPVLFLASNLSNNVVGEILNVNGGNVLCG